jgi:hypothetical protein
LKVKQTFVRRHFDQYKPRITASEFNLNLSADNEWKGPQLALRIKIHKQENELILS